MQKQKYSVSKGSLISKDSVLINVVPKSKVIDPVQRVRISAENVGNTATPTSPFELESYTLYHSFIRGLKVNPEGPCLGYRPVPPDKDAKVPPYQWMTYKQVNEAAVNFGSGLRKLGLQSHAEEKVAIFSKNKPEFDIAQLSCYFYSYTPVPIYATLGKDVCNFIVTQIETKILCCDAAKDPENILQNIQGSTVNTVIWFDEPTEEVRQKFLDAESESGVKLLSYKEVIALGEAAREEISPSTEDELAIILYTSGTTGPPKGVMLKHSSAVIEIGSAHSTLIHSEVLRTPDHTDSYYSYLPSAHSFNFVVTNWIFTIGAKIGYISRGVEGVLDDVQTLKPTIFAIVPRLMNRLYDRIWLNVNSASWLKKKLFKFALSRKVKAYNKGETVKRTTIWDKLVFKKIQALLGGNVRCMICGSAPIKPEILAFMRQTFGSEVCEAYGQTETCAAGTGTWPGCYDAGNVGGPIRCIECKLVSVPDLNYDAEEDKGEVCFRGPNCFVGYFKDPQKTAEAIDAEGWIHTGDIGEWLEDGSLKIIDRKKYIFKLSQGEYIAPEKIESIYLQASLVAQVFVYGDSLESCLVCMVVPDEEALKNAVKTMKEEAQNGHKVDLTTATFSELCKSAAVKKKIFEEIKEKAKEAKLTSLEIVKDIYLHDELLSIENNMLTPTMKNMRPNIQARFKDIFQEMYANMNKPK